MRQLRLLTVWFGFCSFAAMWLVTAPHAALAASSSDAKRIGRPLVELTIRESKDRGGLPDAPGGALGSVLHRDPLLPPEDLRRRPTPLADQQAVVSRARPFERFEGRLSDLELRLFSDAAEGRCLNDSLLAAALVASGVSDVRTLRWYESQVAGLVAELRRSGRVAGPARQQARAIFDFMHQRLLRGGYQLDCTDLTVVLREGRFNCVSASVVFNCLAAEFGLVARGLEVPGHALSRLVLADGNLDVETTCPDWFRLSNNPEKRSELVSKTIGAQRIPGRSSEERREVSDLELVATIYYNRGVDLLGAKRFAEAAGANAKALRLDPNSTTARGNLLATLNNWAVAEASAGRFGEAVELLRQGLTIEPGYEAFRNNYRHVHREWAAHCCRTGDYGQALAVLGRAAQDRPQETVFPGARQEVYRLWARNRLEAGRSEEAEAVLTRARRELGDSSRLPQVDAGGANLPLGHL